MSDSHDGGLSFELQLFMLYGHVLKSSAGWSDLTCSVSYGPRFAPRLYLSSRSFPFPLSFSLAALVLFLSGSSGARLGEVADGSSPSTGVCGSRAPECEHSDGTGLCN